MVETTAELRVQTEHGELYRLPIASDFEFKHPTDFDIDWIDEIYTVSTESEQGLEHISFRFLLSQSKLKEINEFEGEDLLNSVDNHTLKLYNRIVVDECDTVEEVYEQENLEEKLEERRESVEKGDSDD
jgi:hypothetical protein